MKNNIRLIIVLIICTISLIACKKHDDINIDNNFQDLHDTLIQASPYLVNFSETFYDLDVDRDSVVDLTIKTHTNYSSFAIRENYIQILLKNGYEINYSKYIETTWNWNPTLPDTIFHKDTIMIPEIHHINDTIKIDSDFSNSSMMLTYSFDPGVMGRGYNSYISRNIWIADDYNYIVLRKIGVNEKRLAWLKVKVTGYQSIILNSSNYFKETNEISIKQ
jgi:hypothetical protein